MIALAPSHPDAHASLRSQPNLRRSRRLRSRKLLNNPSRAPGVMIGGLEQASGGFWLKSCVSSELPGHFYVSEGLEDLAGGFVSHCGDVVTHRTQNFTLEAGAIFPC